MKIDIKDTVVSFTPENENEQDRLEILWRQIINCDGYALKLVPIGEYVPIEGKKKASFYIEGLKEAVDENAPSAGASKYTPIYVEEDNIAYCTTCNKTVNLKAGDEIPICCGKLMILLD